MFLLQALAVIVLIRAVLPMTEDIKDRAEELREVAKKAGCADPGLVMHSNGTGDIEIEIVCR